MRIFVLKSGFAWEWLTCARVVDTMVDTTTKQEEVEEEAVAPPVRPMFTSTKSLGITYMGILPKPDLIHEFLKNRRFPILLHARYS